MGAGAVAVESAEQSVAQGAGGGGGGAGSGYPDPQATPPRPGRPGVLVFEDEPAIRELLVELLAVEGFRVASAESAPGGLGLLQQLGALPRPGG